MRRSAGRLGLMVRLGRLGLGLGVVLLRALPAAAAIEPSPEIRIARSAGPIAIDGDLGDPGWRGCRKVAMSPM